MKPRMKRAAAEVEPHSRRAKQPRGVSSKVLGRRVEVLSDDVKWFAGTVREYLAALDMHLTQYDDGDQRKHSLAAEIAAGQLRWL